MLIRIALGVGLLVATALVAYIANKFGFLIPVALFVGLLAATAIIAPFADNLGKKLGKKRVSWFGLRPRTTATIATIGSSWVIMILTMVVLLVVVTPLKNALFSYESERARFVSESARFAQETKAYQANLKAYRANLAIAQNTVTGLKTQTRGLKTQANTLQNGIRQSQAEASRYQGQARTFKAQAEDAQTNLKSARRGEQNARRGAQAALLTARNAQASARKAQNAAAAAIAQQATAQKALTETQSSLKSVEAQLSLNKGRLRVAQGRLQTARTQLKLALDQATNAGKQAIRVGRQVIQYERQVIQYQRQISQYQEQISQYQEQISQSQQEVARLEGQSKSLQIQLEDLKKQATESIRNTLNYAALLESGEIRLPVDQALAERRIDATRSKDQITRELNILVDSARVGVGDFFQGATLNVGVSLPSDKPDENLILLNKQAIDFYADVISSANQTVSGRLVSSSNYLKGTKSVLARFVFVPIRPIYSARENIAEASIDPNKNESAIFRQLQDLVTKARVAADERGARPPLSPESMNFFDGDTGPQIFNALRQVQKFDRPVAVRIVAARDLDSAEPLQIRFVVGDEE